ncbi:hypothetical protein AbraIFM66951_000642 [Aspergillus brasiliensis]|uniref:GP-PDE domain-containing protein n=1 Tax=Aspergillus brasiliensis TaxID=319629 RepID=A0A9W6DRU9_9EURO|nr:hypothetical protein AbraCBS73388_001060 [Aspergillus brasiliensis]GKZ48564.1 hypothetical protein AbraIFM66951_000642 [Aspergillus brasiliensis]
MRFGRNIHLHQSPEWAKYHVPYNRLKKLLKTAVERAAKERARPDISDLQSCLDRSIIVHLKFREKQQKNLHKQAEEIHGHYRISLYKFEPTATDNLSLIDLEILCKLLHQILKEVHQLQRYQRLDVEALSRIYAKIDKYLDGEEHQSARSNFLYGFMPQDSFGKTLAANLESWIVHLQEALSDPSSRPACPQPRLYEALRQDQPSIVASMVDESLQQSKSSGQSLISHLLELAVYELRPNTLHTLLFAVLPQNDIPIQAALLSRLITVLGLRKAQLSAPHSCTLFCKVRNLLCEVIEGLGRRSREVLLSEDSLGRFPLHHAASAGLSWVCMAIFNAAKRWYKASRWQLIMHTDERDCSPLDYAVLGNHHDAVSSVLVYLERLSSSYTDDEISPLVHRAFFIALHYQYEDLILMSPRTHSRFCRTPRNGEGASPLHVAARTGRADRVQLLLETVCISEANSVEPIYGWTPLIVACVEGHQAVVDVLLEYEADRDHRDHRGWTAQEHAAFRGHLALAKGIAGPSKWEADTDGLTGASFMKQGDNVRALHQRPQLVVYLGSLQDGKTATPFELRTSALKSKAESYSLLLRISSPGNQSVCQVNLSLLSDTANEPFIFELPDPDEAGLHLELLSLGDGPTREAQLLGGGTSLLTDNLSTFGENRESLVRERTVPILESGSFQVIATVTFTFLIVKPFQHPNNSSERRFILCNNGFHLVGHRGSGQNVAGHDYLQLGENTVEFLHASKIQSPIGHPVSILGSNRHHRDLRSRSLTRGHEHGAQQMQERMRHTVDYMNKGFKPNTRGHVIQDSFATIEELLTQLPEPIGFNIEIKYPRLHEATEAGVAPMAIEINIFVDKILEKIFNLGQGRSIILSSFTPEICILLALKQQTYPVLYITNAGKPPITDKEKRAGSLQAAMRFARRWNLNGIVLASETLVICPRLIGYVQRSRLVCGSYGPLNNIPENAQLQRDAGIYMLIADRVGLITQALQGRIGDDRRLKN